MRTLHRSSLLLIVAVLVSVAACGADDASPSEPASTLPPPTTGADGADAGETLDGSWTLTSGHLDGERIVLVEGWDVTLVIDGDQIQGTAACNGYGGSVAIGDEFGLGGSFAVGELAWTEMACEPAVMDVEQQYLAALQAVDSYELVTTLSLGTSGVGTSLVFDRLPPVPTADVVGTTWVLDTYIEDDAATNVPGMEDATLTLHADGTLTGSTGCRELSGTWIESGPEILFTEFSADGACQPDREQLDGWVVSVLGDGFTAEVDGRRLTVMSAGGEGLSFMAA